MKDPNSQRLIRISKNNIPDDVLDRLKDLEDYNSNDFFDMSVIYKKHTILRILNDKDDDTNETTKQKLLDLYEKVKRYDYIMLI